MADEKRKMISFESDDELSKIIDALMSTKRLKGTSRSDLMRLAIRHYANSFGSIESDKGLDEQTEEVIYSNRIAEALENTLPKHTANISALQRMIAELEVKIARLERKVQE